jgi:hypothetical protein
MLTHPPACNIPKEMLTNTSNDVFLYKHKNSMSFLNTVVKLTKFSMINSRTSDPVVVFLKAVGCSHCDNLDSIWNTPDSVEHQSVTSALRQVNPKIRTEKVVFPYMGGEFDMNLAPRGLMWYSKGWYPMVLFVPGALWDRAMAKLGPKNDVEILEGVQVMNGVKEATQVVHNSNYRGPLPIRNYDVTKPSEFARWLRDCMDADTSKRSGGIIRSIHSSIIKQVNREEQMLDSGFQEQKRVIDIVPKHQACSLKIISRPK